MQSFGGGLPAEGFAGSAVEFGSHGGEVIRTVDGEVGAFGEVLAEEPVGPSYVLSRAAGKDLVELAGDVALDAADGFSPGSSFGDAAGDVLLSWRVVAGSGERDDEACPIGLAVAAAIETVPVGAAGRDGDGRSATEVVERGFGLQPAGVGTGGDEERGGGLGTDAGLVAKLRGDSGRECLEVGVG